MQGEHPYQNASLVLFLLFDLFAKVMCKRAGLLDLLGRHSPAKHACGEETEYVCEQGVVGMV